MIGVEQYQRLNEDYRTGSVEIKTRETIETVEPRPEAIFIRRQYEGPTELEVRFARLKKAIRNRSGAII
jgi:hypothetical protein